MTIDELIEQLQELRRMSPGAAIAPVKVVAAQWCQCCEREPHQLRVDRFVDGVMYAGGSVCIIGEGR